jgi:hypothetical protein
MTRNAQQDRERRLDSIAPMEVLPAPAHPPQHSWHMPLAMAVAIAGTFGVVAFHTTMQEKAASTGAVGRAVSAAHMVPSDAPEQHISGVAAGLNLQVRQAQNEAAAMVPYIDRQAAAWELAGASANASGCVGKGDPGAASVKVTFAPDGRVTNAQVLGELNGSDKAACISQALREARIEPFRGEPLVIRTMVPLR